MTVNGKTVPQGGGSLAQLLREMGYDLARVAVERNGEIVPRAAYGDTQLNPEDTLEVVSFVGGG